MQENISILVINQSDNDLPAYQTKGAAGLDLAAFLKEPITIEPQQTKLIPTGLFFQIPYGYEAQIRSRSGLALKHGITVLNAPGTIDSDYRGEVGVILINQSNKPFTINSGDRIAQTVFAKVERVELIDTDSLSQTDRGENGFGSTKI